MEENVVEGISALASGAHHNFEAFKGFELSDEVVEAGRPEEGFAEFVGMVKPGLQGLGTFLGLWHGRREFLFYEKRIC